MHADLPIARGRKLDPVSWEHVEVEHTAVRSLAGIAG